MESTASRTRLEQRVRAACLTVGEFRKRYHLAGQEIGEDVEVSERTALRWLRGQVVGRPRAVVCRVLEHWFGEPIDVLLGPADRNPDPAHAMPPIGVLPAPVEPIAERVLAAVTNAEALLTAAAREAGEHAVSAAQTLDEGALEQLHAETRRAARAYFTAPPLVLFADLMRLRATVCGQLDRTRKPRHEAELYLILGQVSGLLASVSTALGYLDAAEEQGGASFTYGRIIDHPSLCAWARALQVAATFWSGRARQSAEIGAVALENAPAGTARARLHAVQARALAMIGARDESHAALRAAFEQVELAGADELLDDVGGELGFSRARVELCASSAYVWLGEADHAERAAAAALDLFARLPAGDRWVAGEFGARIDLGVARALGGDLAGTEDALASVFVLEPGRRTEALTQRLLGLSRVLASRPYRGAAEAKRLDARIEDFATHSVGRTTRTVVGSSV